MRRSRDGARGKTIDFFLTDRRVSGTVFPNLGKAGSPFHGAGMALAIHAKRKWGQAIENKQFCEMAYFAPIMISRTYGQRRETVRFARRKDPFVFAGFSASSRPKTQGSEINGGFGRVADVARVGDSEVPPRAPTAGRRIERGTYETFCTQLETRVDFFYFFARNPLKSPDSDE
jgi:hypothetical protein